MEKVTLALEETAEKLGISAETVSREGRRAKAWLRKEFSGQGADMLPQ